MSTTETYQTTEGPITETGWTAFATFYGITVEAAKAPFTTLTVVGKARLKLLVDELILLLGLAG